MVLYFIAVSIEYWSDLRLIQVICGSIILELPVNFNMAEESIYIYIVMR
jgi:hypothetical protein